MCVTICGRFHPDEGAVAGYGNRIRVKYTAKWGVQIAGMIFQTRSSYDHRIRDKSPAKWGVQIAGMIFKHTLGARFATGLYHPVNMQKQKCPLRYTHLSGHFCLFISFFGGFGSN